MQHAEQGLGLKEAIESIRGDLLAARESGESSDIRLPVDSITVELEVVAMRGVEGKTGFKVPVLNLELGGSGTRQWEHTSTVTIVFGAPVDRNGVPVKVAKATDEDLG